MAAAVIRSVRRPPGGGLSGRGGPPEGRGRGGLWRPVVSRGRGRGPQPGGAGGCEAAGRRQRATEAAPRGSAAERGADSLSRGAGVKRRCSRTVSGARVRRGREEERLLSAPGRGRAYSSESRAMRFTAPVGIDLLARASVRVRANPGDRRYTATGEPSDTFREEAS